MIDLKKDLYARLVISAQKDRYANQRFKITKEKYELLKASAIKKPAENSKNKLKNKDSVQAAKISDDEARKNRFLRVEKIEDKIDKMSNNPLVLELRAELEFAQELLREIKIQDKNNPKILSIESDIFRIKKLLDEKTYF